ncbi:MAG: bifunctional glutamate N-acetyltransferase/amino-acid acetyltransferase ArgJ [Candidatus Omnitrophica bacterium]|nr:bifunctional glutamate N-acetyltransferase/amino-acid acetyltransferase ArgJ [Candidatus Omnitrophota bacterium]MDD5436485.1 bifunctional glutamate N-acetyltransferase/amino-acid acetyltransferase ArgJ [Candidatus Omnitrophota bacterium]
MISVIGGVATAIGFVANGVKAGIKKSGNKDLALLYSEVPCVAAAAFTTNRFEASPVKISKLHIRNKTHQAVIVNSGNANCANGKDGDRKARLMAECIAKSLWLDKREVLVASTGIIGVPLPVKNICGKADVLANGLSKDGGRLFAETIMTTDTVKKERAVKIKLGRAVVTIGGACKGVGMIYPVMKAEKHATMLCFITTDAAISKGMLEDALCESIGGSFNMVSVDGDMSTNDSCFILANGMAGNKKITRKNSDYRKFTEGLKFVSAELAKMMARDGEGATKFVEIEVRGAKTKADASAVARKISASSLLKCAISGEDPNWGRVAAACGAAGVGFDPDKTDIYLGSMKALSNGAIAAGYSKEKARKFFTARDVKITVDLKSGKNKATAWTCDFSKEYVAINSEYST